MPSPRATIWRHGWPRRPEARDALEGELAAATEARDALQARLDEATTGREALEAELAAAEEARAELQARLDENAQAIEAAESEAREQTALAENLASRLASVQEGSEDSERSAVELRERIETSLRNAGVEDTVVTVREDNTIAVNLRSEALFNSGRARLSAGGRNLMRRVAGAVGELDNQIIVEGHTDSIPVTGDLQAIFPSNWELSVARAANTVNYLQNEGGMNPDRLSALGYGQYRPVAPNNTREGRALNRRVEIVVEP